MPDEVANTLKSCQVRSARMEQVGRDAAARKPVKIGDEVAEGGGRKPPNDGGTGLGNGKDDFGTHFNRKGKTGAEFKAMIADYDLTRTEVQAAKPYRITDGPSRASTST